MRYVRFPRDRVGTLIGPEGAVKSRIERTLSIKLNIDSETAEVEIDDRQSPDPLAQLKAENVVRAIARGFKPEAAYRLFSDDAYFAVLDIHEYVGKNKEHVRRMTARIVGSEGRTRRHIEELTGAQLSIYGHTVAVIGDLEGYEVAQEACAMLLSGSEHANVYRFLENKRRDARLADLVD